ncbi:MAG TPA: RusA family crossover junction endodeoxyribonuclease [Phycisphaerales bacterium]|nr:RusA family crossover junction endodeoxyribonuclease [Phycisphaerales bacterium]
MSRSVVEFRVRGEPVPEPRPRARVVHTRGGRAIASIYVPATSAAWKRAVAAHASLGMSGRDPETGPVEVALEFWMPRTKPQLRDTAPSGPIPAPERGLGDADNLAKGVLDAMEGVVFVNDSQVVVMKVVKARAPHGQVAGVIVGVYALSPAAPALFEDAAR